MIDLTVCGGCCAPIRFPTFRTYLATLQYNDGEKKESFHARSARRVYFAARSRLIKIHRHVKPIQPFCRDDSVTDKTRLSRIQRGRKNKSISIIRCKLRKWREKEFQQNDLLDNDEKKCSISELYIKSIILGKIASCMFCIEKRYNYRCNLIVKHCQKIWDRIQRN